MKRLWLLGCLALVWSSGIDARNIGPETSVPKLPDKAQAFIEKYFPEEELTQVESDPYAEGGPTYEIQLNRQFRLIFDERGRWRDIEAPDSEVPWEIVPGKIAQYLQSRYPGERIVSISNRAQHYEVTLSAGQELTFDRSGKFIGRDR